MLVLVLAAALSSPPRAEEPLAPADSLEAARQIDREIDDALAAAKVPSSPLADDAEFLRRVTLDITGRIPTAERAAAFLDSQSSDKRQKLIDELLASPLYGDYLASRWTDLIMASGTPPRSVTGAFRQWLAKELNEGRGWDQIVKAMLTAGGTPSESPASWYLRANLREPGQQASTTARFFLGVQVQCAECHDHPFGEWTQADYWGLAAFFTRLNQVSGKGGQKLSEEPPPGKKPPAPGTGARIAIPTGAVKVGAGKVVHAKLLHGAQPSLPDTGPLLPTLADWATAKDNPWFARAAVNRAWAHFFGAGLVNPIDDFRTEVAASHPALLEALSREFVRSGHDLKHLVRSICNSQAYQRSSKPVTGNRDDKTRFSHMAVKVMAPAVLFDSLVAAMGNPKLAGSLGSPLPYELYAPKAASTGRPQPREEFIKFFDTRPDPDATTEYTQGIPQVLALMNAKPFNGIPPIVEQLAKANASAEQAVEKLYLAALSRRPSADEVRLMTDYLARRKDARQGYAGVLWILFNSGEFVLNP
jgi:hypothetical protein